MSPVLAESPLLVVRPLLVVSPLLVVRPLLVVSPLMADRPLSSPYAGASRGERPASSSPQPAARVSAIAIPIVDPRAPRARVIVCVSCEELPSSIFLRALRGRERKSRAHARRSAR